MSLSSIYMDARASELSASSDGDDSSSSGRTAHSRIGHLRRLLCDLFDYVIELFFQKEQIPPWGQCRPDRNAKGLFVAAALS